MSSHGTWVKALLIVVGVAMSIVAAWHAYDRETAAVLEEFEAEVKDLADRFPMYDKI